MRKRNLKLTTPQGKAAWPHLNKPDTKFDKDGIYSINLRLPREDAEGVVNTIKDVLKESVESAKKEQKGKKVKVAPLPIKDVEDEQGNPTGEVEIKFKLRAVGQSGGDSWEQKPAIFDASGKPMTETVGSGSTVKVGCEVVPYYTSMAGAGVTLRLKAVQVLDLVEYTGGGDFDSWSFSKDDSGFVSTGVTSDTSDSSDEEDEHDSGYDF